MRKIHLILIMLFVGLISCENQEDTYEDFSGDGPRKYVGKIDKDGVTVQLGFKRFVIDWETPVDPDVDKIVIEYGEPTTEERKTKEFNADVTHWETETTLEDKTYQLTFYTKDKNGKQSLKTDIYAKPYTLDHEKVRGFGTTYDKYYYANNDLIVVLGLKNNAIKSSIVKYKKGGEELEMTIEQEHYDNSIIVIEDVDADCIAEINKVAVVDGCIDDITFAPEVMSKEDIILGSDAMNFLKNNLLASDEQMVDPEYWKTVEVMDFDYEISSITDILLFENLKKVRLGANRYKDPVDEWGDIHSFMDEPGKFFSSYQVLKYAIENLGVELEYTNPMQYACLDYNWGYHTVEMDFPTAKVIPYPTVMDDILNDVDTWTITANTTHENPDIAKLESIENMLDNDNSTAWNIYPGNEIREHEIVIDMGEEKMVSGIYLCSPNDYNNASQYPGVVKVYAYTDKSMASRAEIATPMPDMNLGLGIGEKTRALFKKPMKARYIRVEASDHASYKNIRIGDILIF
jgi:hypothetical protein